MKAVAERISNITGELFMVKVFKRCIRLATMMPSRRSLG